MRLTDLEPRWVYKEKVFCFLCPHCRKVWLSCKRVVMSTHEQIVIFESAVRGESINVVVPCKAEAAWKFSGGDFETMTITPSLDASDAGHWHGHITNGGIVGGLPA